jgi:hypothetical protein
VVKFHALWKRAPSIDWIGGWVGLRTGLDNMEKILDPTGTCTPTHTDKQTLKEITEAHEGGTKSESRASFSRNNQTWIFESFAFFKLN